MSQNCHPHRFCTKVCMTDADCSSGTACTLSRGTFECQPRCQTKTDCTVYGVIDPNVSSQTLYCVMRTTRGGATATVCAYP